MHKFLLLLLFCSTGRALHAAPELPVRFFADSAGRALFKVNASLQDYRLSGMLIVKRMPGGEIRAVMTMETGIKVFDISAGPRKIRLNDAMKMYRNPFLRQILFRDLRLLLSIPELCSLSNENGIIQSREGKWKYTYANEGNNTLRKTRIKGRKACENADIQLDSDRLLQKSTHDFGKFPYRSEYQRLGTS